MRKIISLSCIAVLFVNLFGYFILFNFQRYKIKAEVEQTLKHEKRKHTRQFTFTEKEYNQLSKYEGGREFSLNGGMYDVVKKEVKEGRIVLTAYFDHKETGLLEKFVSVFEDESNDYGNTNTASFLVLLEYVFQPYQLKYFNEVKSVSLYSFNSDFLSQASAGVASPPPDTFFC